MYTIFFPTKARIGVFRYVGVILLSLLAIPYVIVGENAAALWVIFGRKMTFDIIQKDPTMSNTTTTTTSKSNNSNKADNAKSALLGHSQISNNTTTMEKAEIV